MLRAQVAVIIVCLAVAAWRWGRRRQLTKNSRGLNITPLIVFPREAPSAPAALCDLPDEIMQTILSFCSSTTLLHCRQASPRFNHLLSCAGGGHHVWASVASRSTLLTQRQAAWARADAPASQPVTQCLPVHGLHVSEYIRGPCPCQHGRRRAESAPGCLAERLSCLPGCGSVPGGQ